MKKQLGTLLLLLMFFGSFAQTEQPSLQRQKGYFKKSRAQKAGAFSMLGLGVLFIAGNVAWNHDVANEDALIIFPKTTAGYILGTGLMVGSIPLFDAAAKNKKRSVEATTALKIEHKQGVFSAKTKQSFPALALQITLK